MSEKIKISVLLPAQAERIYHAWLDSKEHSAFTGDPAEIDPALGGEFIAGGDYIRGKNLTLEPHTRIVQSWRTTEFPDDAPDSRLEVLLTPEKDGTRLTLIQTDIPDGQGKMYEDGWREYYFDPMVEYFLK